MHALVSLLDDQFYKKVEELWEILEQKFGVKGIYITPYPHFSYQVAKDYQLENLERVIHTFIKDKKSFRIRTNGLGIFTGQNPVIYIPVVRDMQLSLFHQQLWEDFHGVGFGLSEYYESINWMPHITLGHGDITQENIGEIIEFLNKYDLSWDLNVSNLALIYDTGNKQEIIFKKTM